MPRRELGTPQLSPDEETGVHGERAPCFQAPLQKPPGPSGCPASRQVALCSVREAGRQRGPWPLLSGTPRPREGDMDPEAALCRGVGGRCAWVCGGYFTCSPRRSHSCRHLSSSVFAEAKRKREAPTRVAQLASVGAAGPHLTRGASC